MSGYELYNKVLEAFDGDEGTFNAAARNWIEGTNEVSFEDNEANELFYAAKIACAAWRNKAINGRISKIRMIENVRKIAEKHLPNPYAEPIEEPKEEHIEESAEEIVEEPKAEVVEEKPEPSHLIGVIPEENHGIKEPEHRHEEKPNLFNRRKRR